MAARCASIWRTPAAAPAAAPSVADAARARARRWACATSRPTRAFAEQVRRTKRELLSFLIAAKDAGQARSAATARRARATRCLTTAASAPTSSTSRSTATRTSTAASRRACTSRSARSRRIDAAKPDYVLILPWNLKDEIIHQMRHVGGWGGKFIVPIPEVDGHRSRRSCRHESRAVLRRPRHPHPRVFREHPQADDPGRPPADPVARHAVLQPVRAHAISSCASATRPTSSRSSS